MCTLYIDEEVYKKVGNFKKQTVIIHPLKENFTDDQITNDQLPANIEFTNIS